MRNCNGCGRSKQFPVSKLCFFFQVSYCHNIHVRLFVYFASIKLVYILRDGQYVPVNYNKRGSDDTLFKIVACLQQKYPIRKSVKPAIPFKKTLLTKWLFYSTFQTEGTSFNDSGNIRLRRTTEPPATTTATKLITIQQTIFTHIHQQNCCVQKPWLKVLMFLVLNSVQEIRTTLKIITDYWTARF